ncbi:amidohydrolase [Brevibacillus invocatus]|nr:amidohydrolase [Brevibacillus invocatus]
MIYADEVIRRRNEIFKTYEELNSFAEPSWKEEKTSNYIARFLQEKGLYVRTYEDHYGLIAEIPGQIADVVALRADMDALLQEVDGIEQACHSCGHDAHSTMVMHVAGILAESKIQPYRTIRFIFQPAEETAEGALQMIKDGALDKVNFLFGVHLRPWNELPIRKASPVIIHGSALTIEGQIQGVQAHAARPLEGKNPIESVSLLQQLLGNMRLQTSQNYSVVMTQLKAGGMASNVIPEIAHFTLDIRAATNELLDELKHEIASLFEHVAEIRKTPITWNSSGFAPAAKPNPQAIAILESAIIEILGKESLVDTCISKGAEDFHFYTWSLPHLQATMLGLGCDLKPGLHHPKMTFSRESLVYGTQILLYAIWQAAN